MTNNKIHQQAGSAKGPHASYCSQMYVITEKYVNTNLNLHVTFCQV